MTRDGRINPVVVACALRGIPALPCTVGADWIRDTWALGHDLFLVEMEDDRYSLVARFGHAVEPIIEDVAIDTALAAFDRATQ